MNYKRHNILFLTTRQWNPGDEFILKGAVNIIKQINKDFNAVIFNRHPEIHPNAKIPNPYRRFQKNLKGHTYWGPFVRVGAKDNSFIAQDDDANIFSLLVVAGSPGWPNPASNTLYKYALAHALPTVFLGIGTPYENFSFEGLRQHAQRQLENALVVTTRDSRLANALSCVAAEQLPCPALLSASTARQVERVGTIGFAIGHPSAYTQGVSKSIYELTKHALLKLQQKYRVKVICHFYDELPGLLDDIGSECEVFYSYNSDEYFDALNECDLVVGTRVHAIGAAASLGIPGVFVAHDQRADTVKGFLAELVDPSDRPESLVERVELVADSVVERSSNLALHKSETSRRYHDKLTGNAALMAIMR
jgi:polysaccharide pyruvyl transferase WcaK-like protein